ncbi:MAG: hypothetical protein PUE14_09500 [Clostridia bacterium]|nr:hypothetical protein [Clostridia bacterium]
MKGRLHFVSPKGSASMLADAIGQEVNMIKEALPPAYMPENVILMFLGCEGGKADKTTLEFIRTLNAKRVANAALFCCNPQKNDNAIRQMRDALTAVGVKVLDKAYVCSGKGGLFGGKHPSEEEIKGAASWAQECVSQVSE